ncbi:MAG: ShlB/FhaC/HecB family hemolysin secretion/activation protein [Bacillota bacterium]
MKKVSAIQGRDEKSGLRSMVLAAALLGTVPTAGMAATTPNIPTNTPTPGQVQSTLPTTPPPPQPKSSIPLTTTPPPGPSAVPEGGPTVTVQKFIITGNSVFPDAVLQPLVAGFLGKELTLADLYRAADALTKYYQAHGYGLARATVPEQELANGTVTLQVVEGKIGKVGFEGVGRTHESTLRRQGGALQPGDVYTDKAMDRAVLLVNDLPGVQAQAVLEPGTEFGTADLTYKVTEDPEFYGNATVDNYGRKDVGRWRFNAEFDAASLTGIGDRLSANLTHSETNLLNFGGLTYSLPLGPPGGRLTANYNQTEYRVGGLNPYVIKIRGDSKNGGLSYLFPEERSRLENFYWGAGFQHESSDSLASITSKTKDPTTGKPVTKTDSLGSGSSINFLQLTSYYNHTWEDGGNFSLGGNLNSNGRHNDGVHPTHERLRLELDEGYVTPLLGSNNWTLVTKSTGVWSPEPLNDTDKYSLGGPDNVRGYLPAEVRGDSGLFASVEVEHSFAPDQPFAIGWFADAGKVWDKGFKTLVPPPTCVPSKANNQCVSVTPGSSVTLSSLGVEWIFQSTDKRWQSKVEWAFDTGNHDSSDGYSTKLWITFGMNFQ